MMRFRFPQRTLRVALSLALAVPFLLHAAGVKRVDLLERLEHIAYDARLNLTLPATRDPRIAIVDIDEASLEAIGQWPWSRDTLARLVDRLFDDYGIRALGFDVVFAEPDRTSSARMLERLTAGPLADDPALRHAAERMIPRIDSDQRFAEAIAGRNVVLGFFFRQRTEGKLGRVGALPNDLGLPPAAGARAVPAPTGYGGNLEPLQDAAAGGGFFDNPLVSSDGVFRRIPLLQRHDDRLYELLALATTRAALDWPPLRLETVREGGYHALEALHIGDRRIPVDRRGAIHVPYRGSQGSFPYVPAQDVLDGSAATDVLKDRIVLVGTTAAGLLDLRSTPVQNVFPGVEIQANIISGILDGRSKRQPAYVAGVELSALAALGLLVTALLPLLSPLWMAVVTGGLAGGVMVGNLAAWSGADLVLPLASPVALITALFVFHVAWGFFVESRRKRRLARLFGQYVPPELVDEMDRSAEAITLRGESREMTVLFADVQGFTGLSERLTPQALTGLMNAFLTPMTRVIHDHRGTIDKYMGDAVMAFWGAPLNDPDHARHALRAALDLMGAVEGLGPDLRRQGWPPLAIGIGVNTGVMSVGNMGSEFRMAYTVLGDAVNLGSRLEGLTRSYGVPLIIGEATRAAVPDFAHREIDVVRVKGKDRPVAIFEPLGAEAELSTPARAELDHYHEALARYRARDWAGAADILQRLAKEQPEQPLYRLYLERIALYRRNPPPDDWDGVFTHSSK